MSAPIAPLALNAAVPDCNEPIDGLPIRHVPTSLTLQCGLLTMLSASVCDESRCGADLGLQACCLKVVHPEEIFKHPKSKVRRRIRLCVSRVVLAKKSPFITYSTATRCTNILSYHLMPGTIILTATLLFSYLDEQNTTIMPKKCTKFSLDSKR